MKNKKKMVIGILILCVIAGGIAGGLIYKGQQNKEIQLFEYDKLDTIEHTKKNTSDKENESVPEEQGSTLIMEENQESSGTQTEVNTTNTQNSSQNSAANSVGNSQGNSQENSETAQSSQGNTENSNSSSNNNSKNNSNNNITVDISGEIPTETKATEEKTSSSDQTANQVSDSMSLVVKCVDGVGAAIMQGSYISGSVTLPDTWTENGVTYHIVEISEKAFIDCQDVTSVKIGQYVERIGISAFQNCQSLTNVEFPANLKGIALYAFNNCTSLESVSIPDGTNVNSKAFINCPKLNN